MTLRRNVITLLIWISIVAIFTIHVILTRRNRDQTKIVSAILNEPITERKRMVKTSTETGVIDSIKSIFDFPYGHAHASTSKITTIRDTRMIDRTNKLKDIEEKKEKHLLREVDKLKEEVSKLKSKNEKLKENEEKYKELSNTLTLRLEAKETRSLLKLDPEIPWVFGVTPTYSRFTQKADLVRLSQTLLLVTNFHWIIVEDSNKPTELVENLLKESSLSFTHLNVRTAKDLQKKKWEKYNRHHRGVAQRNLGLKWIHDNVNLNKTPGAVYFMDDDNTYHRKLFDEIRWTKRVSIWPVGLTGGAKWGGPVVVDGKVVRFRSKWAPDRSFAIDMAGFAVGITYLKDEKPFVRFDSNAKRGTLEPTFLELLTTVNDLEPLADNCTKVLVWHTRTETPKDNIKGEKSLSRLEKSNETDIYMEV